MVIWLVDERVTEEKQCYPTQAKTGLEWGTQPSLTKRSEKVTTLGMTKGRFVPSSTVCDVDGRIVRFALCGRLSIPYNSCLGERCPPLLSSRAHPDFLFAALERAACAVFCKENRMEFATPPTLIGDPGQPRDLQCALPERNCEG
jgi:hypothetical protein